MMTTPLQTASQNTLVTVAIPTCNRAGDYLPQALQSALQQTYPNLEIIVSDNHSTDHTESLVRGYSDPRIRYFRQSENIGAPNNFAFCLEQARGKYFLLLHDDDLIDPDFVESCMRAVAEGADVGIIRTGTRTIDARGAVVWQIRNGAVGLSTEGFFRAWFAGKTSPYLCSTLFHTQHLRSIGGLKSKHYNFDDVTAEMQLAARYGRVDIADIKASYRYHGSKQANVRLISAQEIKNWCEDSILLLDMMCQLVPENADQVRREGMRFFSRLCYRYAGMVASARERLLGYFVVFRQFGYGYFPPFFRGSRRLLRRGIRKIRSEIKRASAG